MIIAGSNRDRVRATSATIEPRTLSHGRTPPEPVPQTSPEPGATTARQSASHFAPARLPAALDRLRVALAPTDRLRTAFGRRPLRAAVLPPILLAVLAATFVTVLLLEVRSPPARIALDTLAALMAALLAALLFARLRERLRSQERRAIAHALVRERHRIAADVHDLIMQDLALALANARTLVDDPARAPQASTVVTAGERALAGARNVVSGLTESDPMESVLLERDTRPIAQAVEASVRAAARHTPLTFDAQRAPTSAELDRPTRDALVHIAREAVTNAVKHASPNTIEVVLEHAGQWRLTVRDDGRGFDETPTAALAVGGFGLPSMRQCAHALGGAVHVGSAAGEGTTVEAVIP